MPPAGDTVRPRAVEAARSAPAPPAIRRLGRRHRDDEIRVEQSSVEGERYATHLACDGQAVLGAVVNHHRAFLKPRARAGCRSRWSSARPARRPRPPATSTVCCSCPTPRLPLLAGSRVQLVPVDDDAVRLGSPPPLEPLADIAGAVAEALRYPLSGPPLADRVTRGGRATIVVEAAHAAGSGRRERSTAGRAGSGDRRARSARHGTRTAHGARGRRPRAPCRTGGARAAPAACPRP